MGKECFWFVMSVSLAIAASVYAIVLPTSAPPSAIVHLAAPTHTSIESQKSFVFPRSALLVADALDDLAAEQQVKDAALAAKKRAYQKALEEKQAKEQADFEANQAKLEGAKAKQAAKTAAAAEARTAKDLATAQKSRDASSKNAKYAAVQTVNAKAERIAARKAAGDEAPALFGFGK